MLWRLSTSNQRWRIYDPFLIGENRWRAQRYGIGEGLIDFGQQQVVCFEDLMDDLISLTEEDAEFFDSIAEIQAVRDILKSGTSADRQRRAYKNAIEVEYDREHALQAVVRHLIEEYHADL